MARAIWFEKGTDVATVAAHLDASAKSAVGPLVFAPVQLPGSIDTGILHAAALTVARQRLSLSNTEADRILAQEVRAIDDLVRTANLLVERLREWYALHAPEATRLVTDAKQLATLVSVHGDRTAVMESLKQAHAAQTSLGTDLDPADMAVLQGFARALEAVHASWEQLEARVSVLMQTVAPNVSFVVGPVLGARLIAISGGLTRLATWPAGTVQLLGAETALFRHLKEGTAPPKHGILFQHPDVHKAPPWQRGPTARALALAAATGAKADAFTKNDITEFLGKQLEADKLRIAERKPKPRGMSPRFQKSTGPTYGRGPRGPPSDGGGFRDAAPRRDAPPAYGRDDRGPPMRRDDRGPPMRHDDRGPAPRRDSSPPAPRRDTPGGFGPRDAPARRDSPGGFGPREGSSGGSGSSSYGRGGGFGSRDGAGPRRDGPSGSAPYKRKSQGAFRTDNKPARPPGRGPDDKKRDEGGA